MKTITLAYRKQEVISRMIADGRADLATAFAKEVVALQKFEFIPGKLYDIEGDEYVFAGGGKIRVQYDSRQMNLPGFKGKYKGKRDKTSQTNFVFFDKNGDVEKFPPEYIEDALATKQLKDLSETSDAYLWVDLNTLEEEAIRREAYTLMDDDQNTSGSDQGLDSFGIPYWMETAMGTEWTEAGDRLSDFESIVHTDWEVSGGSNYRGIGSSGDIELFTNGNGDQEVELELEGDWVYNILEGRKLQALMRKHDPSVSWLTEKNNYIRPKVSWFINWSVDSDALKKQLMELYQSDPDGYSSLYSEAASWTVTDRQYRNFQNIMGELVGDPGELGEQGVASAQVKVFTRKPAPHGIVVNSRYLAWHRGKRLYTQADYKRLDTATASSIAREAFSSAFAGKSPTKSQLVQWFKKSAWAETYKPYQFATAIKTLIRNELIVRNGGSLEWTVAKLNRVKALNMSDEARELLLYAQNESSLYRQRVVPISKNLQKKYQAKKYRHDMAWKAWMYAVDDAAKMYAKEHGGGGTKWNEIFPKVDRIQAAKAWADEFIVELEAQGGEMFSSVTAAEESRYRPKKSMTIDGYKDPSFDNPIKIKLNKKQTYRIWGEKEGWTDLQDSESKKTVVYIDLSQQQVSNKWFDSVRLETAEVRADVHWDSDTKLFHRIEKEAKEGKAACDDENEVEVKAAVENMIDAVRLLRTRTGVR